jgi:hypothetical protein
LRRVQRLAQVCIALGQPVAFGDDVGGLLLHQAELIPQGLLLFAHHFELGVGVFEPSRQLVPLDGQGVEAPQHRFEVPFDPRRPLLVDSRRFAKRHAEARALRHQGVDHPAIVGLAAICHLSMLPPVVAHHSEARVELRTTQGRHRGS